MNTTQRKRKLELDDHRALGRDLTEIINTLSRLSCQLDNAFRPHRHDCAHGRRAAGLVRTALSRLDAARCALDDQAFADLLGTDPRVIRSLYYGRTREPYEKPPGAPRLHLVLV